MITKEQHAALCRPFPVEDIEWKLIQAWDRGESGGIGGRCSAFITAREVMARLDLVFGPGGWTSSVVPFEVGKEPGFVCRITAGGVYHEDVADLTDVEAVKGGASGAMKRAAVHFGIGRYLYDLPGGYIQVDPKGVFHGELRKDGTAGGKTRFSWNPPPLPAWAIPDAVDIRVADSFVAIPIEFATAAKRMDPAKIKDKYLAVLSQLPKDMASRPWSDRWDPMTRVDALLELRAQIALYEREHNVTLELK